MSKQRGKNIVGGDISHVGGHVVIGDGVTIVQGDTTRAPIDYLRDLPPLPESLTYPAEPFVGLRWFTRAEARIFFGRGDKIKELHDRLSLKQAPPVTLLYGQSGVGKSSLLHAGLLPRLEAQFAVHYLRRNYDSGLPDQIAAALATSAEQPRLLILDQVEEWLTQPHPGRTDEAVRTAVLMAEHPEVRWLLSFRKEYLAELTELLRGVALAPQFVYLEPLQQRHILEAVTGVSRSEAARKVYGLTMEPGVAEAIAHDIARDRDSHIAPALQVLMTKLWRVATGTVVDDSGLQKVVAQLRGQGLPPSRSEPGLTMTHYQTLIAESGVLMDEFLGEQLRLVGESFPAQARHGLVLGLLRYFTTELGTARSRTREELAQDFTQVAELPQLLAELQNRYLLTDQGGEDAPEGLRLAHDALGPLIRHRFERSKAVGPKALSILETRLLNTDHSDPAPLDTFDLTTVLAARPYMRRWQVAEAELIERSRARRRRYVWLRNAALGLIGVLVIAIGFFGYRNYRYLQVQTAQWWEDQADELVENPTQQLLSYYASWQGDPEAADRIEKMYAVYRTNPLYERLLVDTEIDHAILSEDGRQLVLFKKRGERYWAERYRFDPATRSLESVHELDEVLSAAQAVVASSADGRIVVSGGADHRLHIWDENGRARPTDTLPGKWNISLLTLREDGRQALVAFLGRPEVQRWDLGSGRMVAQYELSRPPSALAFFSEQNGFFAGFADGFIEVFDERGVEVTGITPEPRTPVTELRWNAKARELAAGTESGEIHMYRFEKGVYSLTEMTDYGPTYLSYQPQYRHLPVGSAVDFLAYPGQGHVLVAGQQDDPATVVDASRRRVAYRLKGVNGSLLTAAVLSEGQGVLAVYENQGVYYWHAPVPVPADTLRQPDIERIAWTGTGSPSSLFLATYGQNLLAYTPREARPTPFGDAAHQGERISALAAGADRVVSGDIFGRVLFYDRTTGAPVGTPQPGHRETIRSLQLSPDGDHALSASSDTRLLRWDARTGDTIGTIWQAPFEAVALGPAGARLAVLSTGGEITIRSGRAWQTPEAVFPVKSGSRTVAFLTAGRLVVGGDTGYGWWSTTGDSLHWVTTDPVARIAANRNPGAEVPAAALLRGDSTVWLLDERGYAYQAVRVGLPVKDLQLVGTALWVVTAEGLSEWRVDRPRPEVFVRSILRPELGR